MKGAQVLILLAFFASTFAAVAHKKDAAVEPKGPFDELLQQIIEDILASLTDPMALNDSSVELLWDGILLTSETTGVSISGTSGILVTDVTMGLLGNFVVKVEVPILIATAVSILHHIQSEFVWPEPIHGDGPLEGHLINIQLEVSGTLILLPIGVRNLDYKFAIGGVFINQDGLMGGPDAPGHAEVEAHLNAEGHIALMNIERVNHARILQLITDAIGKKLTKYNH